jgi:adenine-specific DNA-methyltransferase
MAQKSAKNNLGQYFTKNEYLKDNVYKLIRNNPQFILEPSAGRGDLVEYISNKSQVSFDSYEIDDTIDFLGSPPIIADFLTYDVIGSYDTIIGNPPYVKTKTGNLYMDFIKKCVSLLKVSGELIFIVPSDFLKLTCARNMINEMMLAGTFTDIIHPNNENLFENATIDVIIFRYCKSDILEKKTQYNGVEKHIINTNGIITFSITNPENLSLFSEYFDIYVGMVSGKEEVFKNAEYGNVDILNAKNKVDKYILINEFPTENHALNEYLGLNKDALISRKIKKFNEKNWFEWGALRNYKTIENNLGKDCVYITSLTRANEVCFAGKVQYFGGNLVIMIPKQKINLDKLVDYINSAEFKDNYIYSGRFKIGHNQLSNCLFNVSNFA